MNFDQFNKFQAELLAEVVKMKDTKGKEYANNNDRFDNFNEDAKDNDIDRLKAASIFLNKHMRSIKSFIRNKTVYSNEHIRGRFVDAIVYLTLIAGMIEEDETKQKDPINEYLKDQNVGKHQPFEYDPTQPLPWRCNLCTANYANELALNQHIANKH